MYGLGSYPGSKSRLGAQILGRLPKTAFDWYIEPFCGNAPFMRSKFRSYIDPDKTNVWLNDKCTDVFSVLQGVRQKPNDAIISDVLLRVNRCLKGKVQSECNRAMSDLRKGSSPAAFLLLTRLAVRSVVRRSRTKICTPSLSEIDRRLKPLNKTRLIEAVATAEKVQKVSNWDFRRVFDTLPDNSVSFIDPPYWTGSGHDWYEHSFSHRDHHDLHDRLAALDVSRHRFIMSLDINTLSRSLYWRDKRFFCLTLPVTYGCGMKTQEFLVANYPIS